MFTRPQETNPVTDPAISAAGNASTDIAVVAPTVPPAAANPDGVIAPWGVWLAGFMGWAAPPLASTASMIWRKFGPGLAQWIITPAAVEKYILDAAGKIEDLVSHDSIFIPVHPGLFADVVHQIISDVPEALAWIETNGSPVLKAELAMLGVLM